MGQRWCCNRLETVELSVPLAVYSLVRYRSLCFLKYSSPPENHLQMKVKLKLCFYQDIHCSSVRKCTRETAHETTVKALYSFVIIVGFIYFSFHVARYISLNLRD